MKVKECCGNGTVRASFVKGREQALYGAYATDATVRKQSSLPPASRRGTLSDNKTRHQAT